MIRIRTDESLFIVSKDTLNKISNSDLYLIITEQSISNNYIYRDEKDNTVTLYVDTDADMMKILIKILRGGNRDKLCENIDMDLFKETLKRLNINFALMQESKSNVEMTGGDGSEKENKHNETEKYISALFETNSKPVNYHMENDTEDLTEFSSNLTKSINESINVNITNSPPNNLGDSNGTLHKKGRMLKPKILNIN